MEQKRRALGKGLEQLFNNEVLDFSSVEEKIIETAEKDEVINIKLSELRSNPYQPRIHFDEEALNELSMSIKEHGVFQPIIVKKSIKGYEIIAGERRVKASIKAGLETIPAIVRDFTDEQMMEIALLENLQRENLSSIEEAKAYYDIIKALNITQDELAKKVGKSRSYITNMLGLLRLPDNVKTLINQKKITMGHARVLSKLNDLEQINSLSKKIIDDDLSVRQLEEMTNSEVYTKTVPNNSIKKKNNRPYVYVEDILKDKLGTKVKITENKIQISFDSSHDLDRILEILDIKVD